MWGRSVPVSPARCASARRMGSHGVSGAGDPWADNGAAGLQIDLVRRLSGSRCPSARRILPSAWRARGGAGACAQADRLPARGSMWPRRQRGLGRGRSLGGRREAPVHLLYRRSALHAGAGLRAARVKAGAAAALLDRCWRRRRPAPPGRDCAYCRVFWPMRRRGWCGCCRCG